LGISGDYERANMTYKQFLTVRVVGGILLALIVLWGLWAFLGMFEKGERPHVVQVEEGEPLHGAEEAQVPAHPEAVPSAREAPHGAPEATILHEAKAKGVAFVEATISVFEALPSWRPPFRFLTMN
jgi:hypothetical protein